MTHFTGQCDQNGRDWNGKKLGTFREGVLEEIEEGKQRLAEWKARGCPVDRADLEVVRERPTDAGGRVMTCPDGGDHYGTCFQCEEAPKAESGETVALRWRMTQLAAALEAKAGPLVFGVEAPLERQQAQDIRRLLALSEQEGR